MLWVRSGDDTKWMWLLFNDIQWFIILPPNLQVTAAPEVSDLRWNDLRKCLGSAQKSQVSDAVGRRRWKIGPALGHSGTVGLMEGVQPSTTFWENLGNKTNVSFISWFNKVWNAGVKPTSEVLFKPPTLVNLPGRASAYNCLNLFPRFDTFAWIDGRSLSFGAWVASLAHRSPRCRCKLCKDAPKLLRDWSANFITDWKRSFKDWWEPFCLSEDYDFYQFCYVLHIIFIYLLDFLRLSCQLVQEASHPEDRLRIVGIPLFLALVAMQDSWRLRAFAHWNKLQFDCNLLTEPAI